MNWPVRLAWNRWSHAHWFPGWVVSHGRQLADALAAAPAAPPPAMLRQVADHIDEITDSGRRSLPRCPPLMLFSATVSVTPKVD